MEIKVDREGVSMWDDAMDHKMRIRMRDKATYMELFYKLLWKRYFPKVPGNNVVWVLTTKSNFCVCSYFTRTKKMGNRSMIYRLSDLCKKNKEFVFRYYASPEKWKEKIYEEFGGNEYVMWREGFLDECEYCDKLMR